MESCFAKSSNGSGKILNTCTISRKKSVLYCSILLRIIWILEICITYICVKHEYFVSAQIQVILIQIALLPSQMLELSYWLQLSKTFVSARISDNDLYSLLKEPINIDERKDIFPPYCGQILPILQFCTQIIEHTAGNRNIKISEYIRH